MTSTTSIELRTSDFDYDLPKELIAQEPLPERGRSRMMVVERSSGTISHMHIGDLPTYLNPGDITIVNDTKVIPARLFGVRRDTGGKVELLLLEKGVAGPDGKKEEWKALFRSRSSVKAGTMFAAANGGIEGEVTAVGKEGKVTIELCAGEKSVSSVLDEHGFAPLPPYIKRKESSEGRKDGDRKMYQTVFAKNDGAVAAPTAGLHFSDDLIAEIRRKGVAFETVTLHVGPGTFKPVKAELVSDHVMDPERFIVVKTAAEAVNRVKKAGGKVLAVGSTSVRSLESACGDDGTVKACSGASDLFIYPSYRFKVVDCMLTNFHVPKSTLIMMVAAFAGRELVFRAYQEAIRLKYRFYSYGDCMLII